MTDFLRLIDVNAGGFRLKKGQAILQPRSGPNAVGWVVDNVTEVQTRLDGFGQHLCLASVTREGP